VCVWGGGGSAEGVHVMQFHFNQSVERRMRTARPYWDAEAVKRDGRNKATRAATGAAQRTKHQAMLACVCCDELRACMHASAASIWWSNVSLGTTHARTSARAGRGGGRGNDKCVAQLFRAWTHTRRGTVFDELTVRVLLILVPVCACGFVWAR
jgi:hypothetical protein